MLSGGERRIARIAASLGQGIPVDLREDVSGLDYTHTRLVLAAVAHSAGFTEPGMTIKDVNGVPTLTPYDALTTWPTE